MPLWVKAVALSVLLGTATATVVATSPGGDGVVFKTGEECTLSYSLDAEGHWKSMSVDLFSGSNSEMINITSVASGIDGTTGDGKLSWMCPDVTPNAPIYFYQFSQEGASSPVWTSRFTIAAANGSTTDAENPTQPDGSAIPWGVGTLVNSSAFNTSGDLTSGPLIPSGPQGLTANSTDATATPWKWGTGVADPSSNSTNATTTAIGFIQGVACTVDSLCPESAPCCSEAGFCGTGRNCLAGCDPLASFKPAACAPVPACVDSDFKFTSTDRILSDGTTWNGDGVEYDWIVDSRGSNETDIIDDDQLLLTVSEHGNGTALSSTHSVLYGNVSVKIKSSPELGLVTSFVLLSGTKDEIDWEFTDNLTSAGSAYFYEGKVGDYSAAQELSIANRSEDFHEYGINWTPECITWTLDGVALRNVTKNSTLDTSTGLYHYPQTPARIQLLIWPAGVESAAQGTIDWSGGLVNYSSPAYNETGYFASYVESVSVTCYDASLIAAANSTNTTTPGAEDPAQSTSLDPLATSTNTTESQPSESLAANSDPNATATPTAPTVWWTPSVTAWWTPATVADAATATTAPVARSRKLRRFINFLHKRADDAVSAYSYGDVGEDGQVGVSVADAITTLTDGASTGLDMNPLSDSTTDSSGTAIVDSADASGSSSGTETASSSSASTTESGKTVQQKWDGLSTAAKVGIYVGAGVGALALVVLIGWLWRVSARTRANKAAQQGTYSQIANQGEMVSAGPAYTGTGEIISGQDLYSGGQAPYIAKEAKPKRTPTFVGGFVPSSALRKKKQPAAQQQYVPPPEAMAQYMPPGYTGGARY